MGLTVLPTESLEGNHGIFPDILWQRMLARLLKGATSKLRCITLNSFHSTCRNKYEVDSTFPKSTIPRIRESYIFCFRNTDNSFGTVRRGAISWTALDLERASEILYFFPAPLLLSNFTVSNRTTT
jgi:hypothetical protein